MSAHSLHHMRLDIFFDVGICDIKDVCILIISKIDQNFRFHLYQLKGKIWDYLYHIIFAYGLGPVIT